MRLTRVFVETPLASGATVELAEGPAAHLTRVLRLGEGDRCIVFDGRGGEYPAVLATVGKRTAQVRLGEHDPVERESPLQVVLLQGLARGDRMDTVIQKATELGISAIRPVHTQHSGVRLDAVQAERKLAHWRGVAIGACEQSGRTRIPALLPPLGLDEALAAAPLGVRAVLSAASTPTRTVSLATLLANASTPRDAVITVLVGPEGGFADAEEDAAVRAGFVATTLGPRVLRTETAGLAALAMLQALQGDAR